MPSLDPRKGGVERRKKGKRERERKGIPLTSSAPLRQECLALASFLEFLT